MPRLFLLWIILGAHAAMSEVPCTKGTPECRETVTVESQIFSVYRNHGLSTLNPTVQRLVILIHGINRNANEYFEWAMKSAKSANAEQSTLLICPHFKNQEDSKELNALFWEDSLWKFGELSVNEGKTFSSFEVVDRILSQVVTSKKFPNLKTLVITGHSAGGQFTSRYAVTSSVPQANGLAVSYVIGNPSSYLYLNEMRFSQATDRFEKPKTDCESYHHYPYGWLKGNAYVSQTSDAQAKKNLASRQIAIFLGELDTETELLDMSCGANLQGKNRRDRGEIYFRYLKEFHPGKSHSLVRVPEIGHDGAKMYQSVQGQKLLFGELGAW